MQNKEEKTKQIKRDKCDDAVVDGGKFVEVERNYFYSLKETSTCRTIEARFKPHYVVIIPKLGDTSELVESAKKRMCAQGKDVVCEMQGMIRSRASRVKTATAIEIEYGDMSCLTARQILAHVLTERLLDRERTRASEGLDAVLGDMRMSRRELRAMFPETSAMIYPFCSITRCVGMQRALDIAEDLRAKVLERKIAEMRQIVAIPDFAGYYGRICDLSSLRIPTTCAEAREEMRNIVDCVQQRICAIYEELRYVVNNLGDLADWWHPSTAWTTPSDDGEDTVGIYRAGIAERRRFDEYLQMAMETTLKNRMHELFDDNPNRVEELSLMMDNGEYVRAYIDISSEEARAAADSDGDDEDEMTTERAERVIARRFAGVDSIDEQQLARTQRLDMEAEEARAARDIRRSDVAAAQEEETEEAAMEKVATCMVCGEERAYVCRLLPCKHEALCRICLARMQSYMDVDQPTCPICRAIIEDTEPINKH